MFAVLYPVVLVLLHQARDITASVSWPEGEYALLKAKTGCPEEWKDKHGEEICWINQSTVYKKSNQKSKDFHIDANVYNSSVERYFCIKNFSSSGPSWPKGQYCIHTHLQLGMQWGSLRMYGRLSNDGFVTSTCTQYFASILANIIELNFACHTDGNKNIPISLPITKPFYLLPYGSRECQQVKWMVATSEWIKYHTDNYDGRYPHQKRRKVPHHELGPSSSNKGIKMYYCFYESCNYTLNDKNGVFQSPGLNSGEYPDGQLCSWRIMVPDNHTVHVHFINFSLYEYDEDFLKLYEDETGVIKLKQAYFGHHSPFTITATSDLMFVFRSDEKYNSSGFRANYTILKTPQRPTTTSPKPPTTTTQPTTTTKPTTELITTQPPTTKQPTPNQQTTKEAATFSPTTNVNLTTNETVQCNPTTTKDKSHDKRSNQSLKKTLFSDDTWKIVVIVIPLAVFILIVLVIDIFCRYRYKKALKSEKAVLSANDGMVVNLTYERGNIVIDQSTDTVTNEATVDNQPQSRDDLADYEDLDYTQVNEIPPPRRSTKRQESYELEPIGNDTSQSVFYHVLEPPKAELDQPQSHVDEPVGHGTSEKFYHTLEPPADLNRPTYQNLSDVNHYTLNPVYEPTENSAPLVEANKLYDYYKA